MEARKDYYAILSVLPTAEDVVIRAAYKALAHRYHPDRYDGSSDEANLRMTDINEANSILRDPEKRKAYDVELASKNRHARKDSGPREPNEETEAGAKQSAQPRPPKPKSERSHNKPQDGSVDQQESYKPKNSFLDRAKGDIFFWAALVITPLSLVVDDSPMLALGWGGILVWRVLKLS